MSVSSRSKTILTRRATPWEGFISRSHAQELRDLVLDMAKFERDAGDSYFYPFDGEGLTQRGKNLTNRARGFVSCWKSKLCRK